MNRFAIAVSTAVVLSVSAWACGGEEQADDALTKPIGTISVPLDASKKAVRSKEALAGNLVSDAIHYFYPDVDIVLVNGGALRFSEDKRADGVYPAGEWNEGLVRELLSFDFDPDPAKANKLVYVTITGAQLKSVLERGVSSLVNEDGEFKGWFLQVSGVTYKADLAKNPQLLNGEGTAIETEGERIVEIKVGGQDVDPAKTYRVIVNNFTADGADKHFAFSGGTNRSDVGTNSAQLLMNYLKEKGTVTPALDGRISIVQAPAAE